MSIAQQPTIDEKGRLSGGPITILKIVKKVSGTLRMRSRRKDRALVVLQDLEPGLDIGDMVVTVFELQPEIGTEERSPQLGHELFAGISGIPELLAPEGPI